MEVKTCRCLMGLAYQFDRSVTRTEGGCGGGGGGGRFIQS